MPIEIKNVSYTYGKNRKANEVLKDVSFSIEKGEVVSVLGANGVGKSTLFKCILGLLPDYKGSIQIDGEEACKLSAEKLAKKIAYIPQLHYPAFGYSSLNMVLMGTGNRGGALSSPGKKEKEDSYLALEKMEIAHLAERNFASLSGGEQQLVLMARALVQNASTWILDEPVASLDFGNQIMVQEQLVKLAREGYSILMSTHNPEQTFIFSDKIVALKDGRVAAAGKPKDIINDALIKELYGIEVNVNSLYEDRVRICIPKTVITG